MYRLVDIVRTAVVCSDNEVPVAEYLVQIAQVLCCCIGRENGVAALVNERVHLKAIALSCGKHKLPQSCSTHTRHGVGVECRLDYGQILQFERQSIAFESLLKQRHIEVLCAKH